MDLQELFQLADGEWSATLKMCKNISTNDKSFFAKIWKFNFDIFVYWKIIRFYGLTLTCDKISKSVFFETRTCKNWHKFEKIMDFQAWMMYTLGKTNIFLPQKFILKILTIFQKMTRGFLRKTFFWESTFLCDGKYFVLPLRIRIFIFPIFLDFFRSRTC